MNDYQRIERAILFITEHADQQPSLKDIARHVALSEFHFQRLFKRWAGISPKRFIQYLTAQQCSKRLRDTDSTLQAALDSGLSGSGRLHDLIVSVYAMTPAQYRKHGRSIRIEYGWHLTPFGYCLLAVTEKGVCWLSFHDDKSGLDALKTEWHSASFSENSDVTGQVIKQIFQSSCATPQTVMLHIKGTNLQIRVWEALLKIPCTELATYSDIAASIDQPSAVRAVASAVGRNNIAYVIPCHRVIRKSGAQGGYRWGVSRKTVMQAWESAQSFDASAAHTNTG